MACLTNKGRNGLIWPGKFGRENGIARTFESHSANWHKSCGNRQNQIEPNWITYLKVLANKAANEHEIFSREQKCSSMFLLEGTDYRGLM